MSHTQCSAAKRADDGSVLGASGNLDLGLGSLMPSDAVLRLCEFYEPLDSDTRHLYREILDSV